MKKTTDNAWYQKTWLPFAAATYIIICLFDFMIMPVYVAAHNSRVESRVFALLEGKDAATFADGLVKSNQATRQWNPLTLLGGGMFHLAFGALLTGGAVTRGIAKKSEVEGYYRSGTGYYEEEDANAYRQGRPSYGYGGGYRNQHPPSTATNKPMPKTTDLDDDT